MTCAHSDDISVNLTTIFLKVTGFWMRGNRVEQRYRDLVLIYTIVGSFFLGWVMVVDCYYSWGDFGTCLYIACNILSLFLAVLKLSAMLLHRKDFVYLVVYLQQKFLRSNYDFYERTILNRCKRKCAYIICCYSCCAHATLISYVVRPIIANIGQNASDRIHPFTMWGEWPTITPYFEITYILQALSLYQIGLCYFSFDNILCIINLHVATQFHILQYRLESMNKVKNKGNDGGNDADKYYSAFKDYVQQHQAMIAYCKMLEDVFRVFAFIQVLVFSMLLCLDGFQVLMADAPTSRRLIFVFHITGCIWQLFMFTYGCDCLTQGSMNMATATYAVPWTSLPMDQNGKMLRRDVLFVIIRSRLPCSITAGGFFAVSLETYTRILSTAVSYFTLLKQHMMDAA